MVAKTSYKLDENVLALTITLRAWGNRRKADKNKVEANMDKRMLSATKKLLDSAEWKAVVDHICETKDWIVRRSMPMFTMRGVYLVKKEMVNDIEEYLAKRQKELNVLVDNFLNVYYLQIEQAKELLGDQFKRTDYPREEYLRYAFGVTTRWIAFDVPKALPKELYDAEKEKAEKMWRETAEQITFALRESFLKLISHLTERLSSGKDEKKIFRNSAIDKIYEFIEEFKIRNLTNDKELETLVEKARQIIAGVDADDLRNSARLRNSIRLKFNIIEKELDGMIETKKTRKFDFDEE